MAVLPLGPAFAQKATINLLAYRLIAKYVLVSCITVNLSHIWTVGIDLAYALTILCGLTGVTVVLLYSYHCMYRPNIWLGAKTSGITTITARAQVSGTNFLQKTSM